MRPRRRRFREETVAPWLTMIVIVGVWWVGAWLVESSGRPTGRTSSETRAVPSEMVAATEPDAAGASARSDERPGDAARAMSGEAPSNSGGTRSASGIDSMPAGRAVVPVVGVDVSTLQSTFDDARGGGSRRHEAMDILAPRGTPVLAAVDGRVVKLFTSAAGGLTIYQFDREERFCYYYAHLDAYAPDLNEGEDVRRGQIIGYVGTTGNAPPETPHLHFAVYRLGPEKKWWDGEPIDPIDVLR